MNINGHGTALVDICYQFIAWDGGIESRLPFCSRIPHERLAGFVMHQGERYWKREWVIEGIPAIGIPRVNPRGCSMIKALFTRF